MSIHQMRIIGAGLFFVFIFSSGFWLKRGGKPYNGLLFNLHKLIGLGALIALALTASQLHKASPLETVEIAAVGISVALFVVTIITGGLASLSTPLPTAVKRLHKVFPYLTALSSAAALYQVLR